MIVPERYRYVIIIVLINILQVACRVAKREASASASQCRQISNTTLDCSRLSLTSIPNDIPNTILALNMSFNQLTVLSHATFDLCCRHLEELDLSSNGISDLPRDSFKSLTNVTRLFLRNNSISDFEADTFESNKRLERLDLSQNPLQIQSTPNGFLINSRLEELNLDDCNLVEIPEGAFHGISQLKNLTLVGNPLDENMDVSAFEDLTSLIRLQTMNISRESTADLCENLVAIDTINFEGFNLTCYVLLLEGNFDDAIDRLIEQPIQLPILPAPPVRTTTPSTSTTSTTTTTTESHELPSEKNSNSSSPVETIDQRPVTSPPEITNHAVVDIDNETIKFILMGILGVTLIGILIGFVCRSDVGGIKTKMCRNKKSTANRRSSADTAVSPFEEIPLNTVNTNGKTIEGQG